MTLHVVATFVARPDTIEQVRSLLSTLIEPIRNDPGCERCHFAVNQQDKAEMVFVEEWRGGASLDRHLEDEFVVKIVGLVTPLLTTPLTLRRYSAPD